MQGNNAYTLWWVALWTYLLQAGMSILVPNINRSGQKICLRKSATKHTLPVAKHKNHSAEINSCNLSTFCGESFVCGE